MKRVESSELVRYNANVRGKNVGDCVKRAISLAFDLPYNEVSKFLVESMRSKNASAWNYIYVYEPVIMGLGGDRFVSVPNNYAWTLDKFADEHAEGTWLVLTGPKADGYQNHIVCIIDGKIYDSWDSREQYVKGYWKVIEGNVKHEFTDIADHQKELYEQAKSEIQEYCDKYIEKYHLNVAYLDIDGYSSDYKVYIEVDIKVTGELSGKHGYTFKTVYVFTPTTTLEKAKKMISETSKIRMYDRFYEINKKLSEAEEGASLALQSDKLGYGKQAAVTSQERRFLNSLPGWVIPFVTWVDISSPGQYSDSYNLNFNPIPGDPNKSKVKLYGYNSDTIKAELKMYKEEGFKRPGIDYDVSEMF